MLLVWSSPTATSASGGPCATSTPRRKSSVAGITASSNILAKVPKREQPTALLILRQIPYAESRQEAETPQAGFFQEWCRSRGLAPAADLLDQDWDRMVSFYNYPKQQWQHLRTTNPVESPFAGLRLRTDAAKRFKKVNNAQAVIWKMLLVAEKTISVVSKLQSS